MAVTAVLVVLILIGGAVGVTVALRKSGSPACPGCGTNASTLDPLPEAATFESPDLHFKVDYPADWSITARAGDSVTFHTQIVSPADGKVVLEGVLIVKGSSTTDTGQLIDQARSLLPSSYSDLTEVGGIRGAHIADTDGDGKLYKAKFTGPDGTSNGSVSIVAAARNGLGIVVVGADPAAGDDSSGVPAEGDRFDYLLTEFRWPG